MYRSFPNSVPAWQKQSFWIIIENILNFHLLYRTEHYTEISGTYNTIVHSLHTKNGLRRICRLKIALRKSNCGQYLKAPTVSCFRQDDNFIQSETERKHRDDSNDRFQRRIGSVGKRHLLYRLGRWRSNVRPEIVAILLSKFWRYTAIIWKIYLSFPEAACKLSRSDLRSG